MAKLFNSLITQPPGPQAAGLPLPAWRVKLSNGAVYGPIELDELRTWAQECRLAPGDQVSSDTVHWVNAETLPELAMHWMVEMASGEIFGPVHLHAVVDFFHSRLVIPSSRLTNRSTGEVATVADLVLPLIPDVAKDEFPAGAPVVAENAASDDRLIKFNQGTGPARLPPDQPREKPQLRIELLQATVDESKACIKQLQGDLDSQQAQTLKLRDDAAALEKTYLVKLGDARKKYDVAADMIKDAETQIQALKAALAQKEQHGAEAARDWDSDRSEKESRIQTLTRQIEVLTADQTLMRSVLEQNRAEFEQARQETRKLATRAKELNDCISGLDSQVQNVSENLATSAAEVAGKRERIEVMTDEHLQKETQLQTGIEDLTGRRHTLNQELGTVRGELTGRVTDIKDMSERVLSMEKSRITSVPDRQKVSHKPGKKVLVVDDSEVIQQLIAKLAEKHGASVTAAASARDVTEILAEKACRFDLFVLDLILPEITGWEILETLRTKPETKDTPIVIFAGPLSSQEREKILQKANAVIEKSNFTLRNIDKVLDQWL
ncbi:MAG: response regulator [Lentisphaerae bacterium]|nr:response regulator [Lentisphaerota bacterium]